MSTQTTETTDATETRTDGETDSGPRTGRILSTVRRGTGGGTPASLAGGTLLVAAARAAARNRRRAGVFAVAGVALLGAALRRRTSEDTSRPDEPMGGDSTEAAAHLTASDLVDSSQTNPRGVSDESDVDSAGDGAIQFATGGDETGERKPHLDGSDPADPRYADREDPLPDDHVEVSLSETKTTDELGKAVAPDEEQAYPASEGTDPEPMSEKAPPRYGEAHDANEDTDGAESETGDEAGEPGIEEGDAPGDDESP